MNTKHRPPSTVRLRMTYEDGDTVTTTWGEFLTANRKDRSTCGAVWNVVTKATPQITLKGVTVTLEEMP
jgi:hypothetical protein